MTGRFGFDPSASWEALNVGFSPDEQGIAVRTSPPTEILAAIGLQRCRPARMERRGRWFAYRAWLDPVEVSVVPVVFVGVGRALATYEFPVVMRNAQYGNFAWARLREDKNEYMERSG
jgi:CRISPR-associated protein Csx14